MHVFVRRKLILAALVAALGTGGCTTINPGHVGIVVNNLGSNRGVQDYTPTTGFVAYNPFTTSVVEYPTYVQTIKWTATPKEGGLNDKGPGTEDESITFTNKQSVVINADVSLSFQLVQKDIPAFYVKFRSDDLAVFAYGYLHNITRDAMTEVGGHYTTEQIMGDNEAFLHEVRSRIQTQLTPLGVEIQQFGFIGAPRPPQNIVEAINSAQAAQYAAIQSQNELQKTQAEAAKTIAQAEGQAKANLILANSITDKLLEKQRLEIQDRWINRWNGVMPTVTGGGNNGLLLQVPQK
jgi:regulator of protease activity HflC (stomatin/prohibitin superfamily)